MTEKPGLEKTVVFNLKSAYESDVYNIVNEKGHESRSFYYKLGLLYFLNIVDWICTEALLTKYLKISSIKILRQNP